MLDIQEIKKQYPDNLHKFERGLLREYLQFNILSIIFTHKLSKKLTFVGGTSLRIVHNMKRFSEDIDFDNKSLSKEEFEKLGKYIKQELEKLGFIVEIKFVTTNIFHCSVKFPNLLYKQGLTPIEEEKILVRIDTFDQGVQYAPEVFILNKFDIFKQIIVAPKDIILAQKLYTITNRKRLKGRDFYDTMFLLQNTQPNIAFLNEKFGTKNITEIKSFVLEKLKNVDFNLLAEDVQPFLQEENAKAMFNNFKHFLNQQLN